MDQDDRFKHLATDPKFRRIPKTERKIKIDKRFKSMFNDEKFKVKYTIDKRGRPINHNSAEDLKRYYELESEDESSSSDEDDENDSEKRRSKSDESSDADNNDTETGKFVRPPKSIENELEKTVKTDKEIPNKIKKKLKNLTVDYARGEGTLVSDSSSDDDSEPEVSDAESVDHGWGELDKDADRTEDVTNRLAVCNQDWDRIRAVDLMVLFTSFVPSGGVIESVTIYPSDFGLERLKEEEIKGPIELVETKNKYDDSDDEETEEGSKYHMEKLRQYQLNRLKYYYAIVVCDTPETANKIYTECDGLEYESSSTKIDLRFVPDGTEFENAPKDVCDKIPEKYQPRFFTTTALQQAKVELTWDETNPERAEVAKKLSSGSIDDVTDADLQAYLASSSGEESEEEQEKSENSDSQEDVNKNPIDKYRALLNDIEKTEKEKDNKGVEMEITWGINVKEKTEKLVKKKLAENEEKTPFEQYLDKRKEKKKAKREERKKKQKESDQSDSEDSDIPSDVDMNDPYFAEEFDKPEFKKKKSKSKNKTGPTSEESEQSKQEKAELELLLLNDDEDTRKHFNLKKIQDEENMSKKKRKKKKQNGTSTDEKQEDNFEVDVKDDRFSALYSSHHFNIDPTDPHFKKTKAMEKLIEEKLKRRNDNEDSKTITKKPKLEINKAAELSVLVKSIKRKTKNFGAKK